MILKGVVSEDIVKEHRMRLEQLLGNSATSKGQIKDSTQNDMPKMDFSVTKIILLFLEPTIMLTT